MCLYCLSMLSWTASDLDIQAMRPRAMIGLLGRVDEAAVMSSLAKVSRQPVENLHLVNITICNVPTN